MLTCEWSAKNQFTAKEKNATVPERRAAMRDSFCSLFSAPCLEVMEAISATMSCFLPKLASVTFVVLLGHITDDIGKNI